ncbi:MAG: phosphomannomutase [Nitrospirae bacterium GWB2_47_37]|nr:MAG: phosphomannomutase [Nitrospirae bacterium GWA2_46_11]OGW24946.1 MAG: phosphomannomutase [Nitrospirae bacterium GWB2_47_37]HAK88234.1 phosphomannomutase [Nitrospiraceae bacterium]
MVQTFENAAACWKEMLADASKGRELLPVIEKFARDNKSPAKVVFGTSGWRGEIGTDFTFNNVRIVTAAIIEMLKSNDAVVMRAMGVKDFEDIKKRGVIVGHDNRFLGPDFAVEVIGILQKEGIKTLYAGEAITPEFSAGIEMLNAACSINLTPSHNPANYAGFKFNPSDGGPAGTEITAKIEEIANTMMKESKAIQPVKPDNVDKIDLTELYIKYITGRKTLDIGRIRDFINGTDCVICIDNVHGATRGRIQRIIGESSKIKYLRTEDDYLFGGVAPEPSEKNMEGVEKVLKQSNARFKLGAIMDPDGDRIRFAAGYGDGIVQIPMNYFGAMALHFLYKHKGIKGVVAKSVGTSNFVNAIAEKLGIPIKETKVGFKNFRPYMLKASSERAIVAFEESDGISGYNHTLEKDAVFGLLLSIEMTAVTGKNLNEYLKDIMDEFGYYYPDRSGIAVDPSLVGEPLIRKLSVINENYKVGMSVDIGGRTKVVKDMITVDGTKIVFDDGSWLMIRPSGTEPKVRFYIEARTEDGKKAVFETAEKMTGESLRGT